MSSIVNYVADGSTTEFQIPFTYISEAHVVVTIDGTATSAFTFLNSSTLQMTTAPTAGSKLQIQRTTPVGALVDFTDGSTLFEGDLDLAHQQNRLIAEESKDIANVAKTTIDNNIADVNTVAGIAADVTNVASRGADVTSVADNMAEVLLADTNAATATTKAAEAVVSANTASAQAVISTTKATESSASAAAALASQNAAQQARTDTDASEALALAYKNSAQTSATTATTKASEASQSATTASSQAATATQKASEASTDAGIALAQAAVATTKAAAASTSESNALSYKDTALAASSASETARAASVVAKDASQVAQTASEAARDAASASETAAATSETNAATSAATATTQAGISTTKAGEAATSASNAASSASSAQASKDAALAALDSFDDRYLGQKTADPTLDNDGDALVSGSLYFNTTDDIMKVYDGSLWVAAYASLSGAMFGANNLSDVADAAASRTNLGLGTAATTASTDYATAAQGALADSALQSIPDNYVLNTGDTMTGNLDVQGTVTADKLTVSGVGVVAHLERTDADTILGLKRSGVVQGYLGANTSGDIRFYNASPATKLNLASNGDISFYEDTGTTPKMVWKSADERLGIGTVAPTTKLQSKGGSISTPTNNAGLIANASASFVVDHGNDYGIYTGYVNSTNDAVGIAATRTLGGALPLSLQPFGGNVGIGTSSPTGVHSLAKVLELDGGDGSEINLGLTAPNVGSGAFVGGIGFKNVDGSLGTAPHYAGIKSKTTSTLGTMDLRFYSGTGNYEADTPQMLLDASGNLLVGTTDNANTRYTATSGGGTVIQASSFSVFSRETTASNQAVMTINNTGVDAIFTEFLKDGSTVGSIGTRSAGEIYIGSNDTGIQFNESADNIIPVNTATQSIRDNAIDLGYSSGRFKDGYFSGTVNAANFNTTSDATLKTNVETLTGSLDAVKSLRGVSFDWLENGNSEVGVIAQEVEAVLPNVVSTNDQGIKSVKYGNMVALLIEAMKEQQLRIEALEAKLGE